MTSAALGRSTLRPQPFVNQGLTVRPRQPAPAPRACTSCAAGVRFCAGIFLRDTSTGGAASGYSRSMVGHGATPSAHDAEPRKEAVLLGPARVLDWAELTDVIDLCLWIGELMLEHGASAPRVEQTVERVGQALGVDHLDILVSPNVLMATTTEGKDFRTKARRIGELRVDLARLVAVSALAREVCAGRCDRASLRLRLGELEKRGPLYPRCLSALAAGSACAAFCKLFGGDWRAFSVVLAGATAGTLVRQRLAARKVPHVLNVVATAFVAGALAALGGRFLATQTPEHAMASVVLMLIPGVALMNAFEELVRGYTTMAVARGAQGVLVSFAIALGLLLAMRAVGAQAL